MCCTVMQPDEGYIKAKTLLRQRFGDSNVIADAWMNKITSGPAIKPSENDALQCLADDLCNCFETLKAMKRLCEVNSQKTLARVVERLASYLQFRWRREAREIRKKRKDEEGDPSLEDLMLLVSDAAAEANDLVFKLSSNSSNESRWATHASTNRQADAVFSTTSAKVMQPGDNSQAQREDPSWYRPCVFCNESHSPFSCHHFKGWFVEERIRQVKSKRLCFNCLAPDHISKDCPVRRTCSVHGCGQKHTKFLHRVVHKTDQNVESSATNGFSAAGMISVAECMSIGAGIMHVALPIVPVLVRYVRLILTLQFQHMPFWTRNRQIRFVPSALLTNCISRVANRSRR